MSGDEIAEHYRLTGAVPPPSRIRQHDPSGWRFVNSTQPFPIDIVKWATCFECVRLGIGDARQPSTEFESHLRTEHALTPQAYIEAYPETHDHFGVWYVGSTDDDV